MELADTTNPHAPNLIGESKLPVAVLATPDGTPVNKLENKDGRLKVELVEKLVANEVKQREATVNTQLKEAKEKVKAGDNAGAIPLLKSVAEQQCMFPKKAKDAAKELKKLQWIKIEPRWDSLRSDPTLPRLDAAHRTSPVMRLGRLR